MAIIHFKINCSPQLLLLLFNFIVRHREMFLVAFCTFSYDRTVPCLTCWQIERCFFCSPISHICAILFLMKTFILHYQINHGTIFMFFSLWNALDALYQEWSKQKCTENGKRRAYSFEKTTMQKHIYSFCMKEKGWKKNYVILGKKKKIK